MEILTREEIKERRRYLFNTSEKLTKIRKGDKRVNGSRLCGMCGKRLSTVLSTDGSTQAIRDHFHCSFSELFYVDLCMDIRSCYAEMDRLRKEERG